MEDRNASRIFERRGRRVRRIPREKWARLPAAMAPTKERGYKLKESPYGEKKEPDGDGPKGNKIGETLTQRAPRAAFRILVFLAGGGLLAEKC